MWIASSLAISLGIDTLEGAQAYQTAQVVYLVTTVAVSGIILLAVALIVRKLFNGGRASEGMLIVLLIVLGYAAVVLVITVPELAAWLASPEGQIIRILAE